VVGGTAKRRGPPSEDDPEPSPPPRKYCDVTVKDESDSEREYDDEVEEAILKLAELSGCLDEPAEDEEAPLPVPAEPPPEIGAAWDESRVQVLKDMMRLAGRLFPEIVLPREIALGIVDKALQAGDLAYGVADAIAWAQGKGWEGIPPAALAQDEADFEAAGHDLTELATQRLAKILGARFNPARVREFLDDQNPEFMRMLALAEGFPVFRDPLHVPNGDGVWPKRSRLAKEAGAAVEKMFHDGMHTPGLAIYLKAALVRRYIADATISACSWATAAAKKKGRGITNCSYSGKGSTPLNTPHTKKRGDEHYGGIELPVIGDYPRMVETFFRAAQKANPDVHWSDLVLWSMDLRGAFTLLGVKPEDAKHLAVELENDIIVFFLCGTFGWNAMPATFQTASRAVRWELERLVSGLVLLYVDDVFSASLRWDVDRDLEIASTFIRNLFGDTAVAIEKTVYGRVLNSIGYTLDLDKRLVYIAERNVHKAMYGFMTTDLGESVTVQQLMRLGSWASRYGTICRHMRPFSRFIYAAYAGRRNLYATVAMTSALRIVIRLFRVLFLLSSLNLAVFSRPFASFLRRTARLIAEFDACLTGVGVIWYLREADGSESPIGYAVVDLIPLNFTKSDFQNLAEFIGGIFAARGLARLKGADVDGTPWANTPFAFRGDSLSSLAWLKKGKVRSDLASPAGVVYVYQNIHLDLPLVRDDCAWQAGVDNGLTDKLSRNGCIEDLDRKQPGRGWLQVPRVDLAPEAILDLCGPRNFLDSEHEFEQFMGRVQRALLL